VGVKEAGYPTMNAVSIISEGAHTTLRCEQWVPKPVVEVFTFFCLQRTPLLAWVDKDVEQIFIYRQQIIADMFSARRS
jgi:hypothetical protein